MWVFYTVKSLFGSYYFFHIQFVSFQFWNSWVGLLIRYSHKTVIILKWWSIALKRTANNKDSHDHDCPHSHKTRLSASAIHPTFSASIHIRAFWWHEMIVTIQPISRYQVLTMIWEWLNQSMKIGQNLLHHGCT